jgi:hypothetical protein
MFSSTGTGFDHNSMESNQNVQPTANRFKQLEKAIIREEYIFVTDVCGLYIMVSLTQNLYFSLMKLGSI